MLKPQVGEDEGLAPPVNPGLCLAGRVAPAVTIRRARELKCKSLPQVGEDKELAPPVSRALALVGKCRLWAAFG